MNKPVDITETENFWHLLPNVTPDTELRKALKTNLTVAKIVKGKLFFLKIKISFLIFRMETQVANK